VSECVSGWSQSCSDDVGVRIQLLDPRISYLCNPFRLLGLKGNHQLNHWPFKRDDKEMLSPGPVALECFALAKAAVETAEKSPECTKHVYRSQHSSKNQELWQVGTTTQADDSTATTTNENWIMHVDCAGFVRNVLETTMNKRPFAPALSDRSFMRAKDFCTFFEHLPSIDIEKENNLKVDSNSSKLPSSGCWRRVDDLRTIQPGDIISYRHGGRAAAGAAFVEMTSLHKLFKALKVKFLYDDEVNIKNGGMVDRNVSLDASVEAWTESMIHGLAESYGITSLEMLKERFEDDKDVQKFMLDNNIDSSLLKEALQSKCKDTGHVMFAAGPPEQVDSNKWRIPVCESTTTSGKHPGVQQGFRTFTLAKNGRWFWEGDTNILGVPDVVFAGRLLL